MKMYGFAWHLLLILPPESSVLLYCTLCFPLLSSCYGIVEFVPSFGIKFVSVISKE